MHYSMDSNTKALVYFTNGNLIDKAGNSWKLNGSKPNYLYDEKYGYFIQGNNSGYYSANINTGNEFTIDSYTYVNTNVSYKSGCWGTNNFDTGTHLSIISDSRIHLWQNHYDTDKRVSKGWHHIALVQKGNTSYRFIDGNLLATVQSGVHTNSQIFLLKSGDGVGDSKVALAYFRISDCARWTSNFDINKLWNRQGLLTAKNPISLLDKISIKGFTIDGVQPANTNRKVAFKVDNKWNKLTTEGALSPLPTQAITSDSVLAEGNTVAELTALTNVPSLAGKLVYPAFALYADSEATVMPTIGMTVKAEIDTTVNVYTKTAYSQEFVLHNKRDVLVKSISVDSNTKGNGKVTLKARYATFDETAITEEGAELTEKWSDYVDLLSVINVKCHKLQIKADYQVSITDGSDSATLNDVIITYAKDVVAKADGTTDLVTLTEKFTNDLTYVHAYIKHAPLIDADLKAYVRLQKTPKNAEFKLIGYGTGARKTYKVTDDGINQDSLMVYVNGKVVYDFDFNTETLEITLVADVDVPINATYEFGWELFNYVEMQKGVSQVNDSGAYTTEYSYTIPEHEGEYTVTAIKYELIRPEGKVADEVIGVGTGKRQIIQLPHFARKETISCNGKWSYDYDSKRLTVIAPADTDIVISYDWIAESPVVYAVMAGWAD